MKINWLSINYAYLQDNDVLNISDIFSILSILQRIEYDIDSALKLWSIKQASSIIWKKDFYINLIKSLLLWIDSKYTIKEYILEDFNSSVPNKIVSWLLMIRSRKINYIHCFSQDYVWIRFDFRPIKDDNLRNELSKQVNTYYDTVKQFRDELLKIDKLLSSLIWEEYDKSISFKDLKTNFGFSVNLSEVQDKYFLI